MLAAIMISVFPEVIILGGAYFESDAGFLNGNGEAIFYTTSLRSLLQVTSIFDPSFVVAKKSAEDLCAPYPQSRFW